MKAAALKKAKNVTMCLALNVQWSSPSNAAMLSVKSFMMRCSTEMKEECFESPGHECTTETSEQCKDVHCPAYGVS